MNPAVTHAAPVALAIVLGFAVLFAALVFIASRLRPHPVGRHRLDGDKTATWFRSLATDTPAPVQGPVQAWRPGDPRSGVRAVRGAATTEDAAFAAAWFRALGPGGSPVPPGAALEPPAPARAAPLPGPGTSPAGTGQPPFDGHREPWYVTIGERTPPGRLLAIGYEPFDTGPRAVITDPCVSLRRTGAHAAIDDGPLVPVRPYAEQWWLKWDEGANEQ